MGVETRNYVDQKSKRVESRLEGGAAAAKAKSAWLNLKGTVEKGVGKLADNDDLAFDGAMDKLKAKGEALVGDAKKGTADFLKAARKEREAKLEKKAA